jgi:hypothetical protein
MKLHVAADHDVRRRVDASADLAAGPDRDAFADPGPRVLQRHEARPKTILDLTRDDLARFRCLDPDRDQDVRFAVKPVCAAQQRQVEQCRIFANPVLCQKAETGHGRAVRRNIFDKLEHFACKTARAVDDELSGRRCGHFRES